MHKILNRDKEHWTQKMLYQLRENDLGWAKNIMTKLTEYQLETDWEQIWEKTKGEWKSNVERAVDEKNKNKLIQKLTTQTTEGTKVNTKTQKIHEQLTTQTYIREPIQEITKTNKTATRTLILARNGMLECGTNFKGTLPETCRYCNVTDNENHRMNF